MVPVFNFNKYDISMDHIAKRPIKATRDAIRRARGIIIEGTKEFVDPAMLDGAGYYRSSPFVKN